MVHRSAPEPFFPNSQFVERYDLVTATSTCKFYEIRRSGDNLTELIDTPHLKINQAVYGMATVRRVKKNITASNTMHSKIITVGMCSQIETIQAVVFCNRLQFFFRCVCVLNNMHKKYYKIFVILKPCLCLHQVDTNT